MFNDLQNSNTRIISMEFCLVILLLLLIFFVNILHVLYLIIYSHTKSIQSIRLILINSSIASLIVSIWLIPFFYFRTMWPSESIAWCFWSFLFHVVDAVQIYSLFLLLTIRSFEKSSICFIWFASIVAYSPLLWLTASNEPIDYLPYRRLTLNLPSWILPMLYASMYLIPILVSLVLSLIRIFYPWIGFHYSKKRRNTEHHQEMRELTDLIETVLSFQLEQSTHQSNLCKTWISSVVKTRSKRLDRSLSCPNESDFLVDALSITPSIEQPLNSYRLFIIACLFLLVHFPYILFSFLDFTSLQLSVFIYLHWFGTLFVPIIHIQ